MNRRKPRPLKLLVLCRHLTSISEQQYKETKEKNLELQEKLEEMQSQMIEMMNQFEEMKKNQNKPTNIRIESLKDYEDIRSVKHHLQFSPKKPDYQQNNRSVMKEEPKINTNAPTEPWNNFDVEKETNLVLGKESLDQGKSPKGLKFAESLFVGYIFCWVVEEIQIQNIDSKPEGKAAQIKYSFNAYIDPTIKQYFCDW
jgi:hypothetical protein